MHSHSLGQPVSAECQSKFGAADTPARNQHLLCSALHGTALYCGLLFAFPEEKILQRKEESALRRRAETRNPREGCEVERLCVLLQLSSSSSSSSLLLLHCFLCSLVQSCAVYVDLVVEEQHNIHVRGN